MQQQKLLNFIALVWSCCFEHLQEALELQNKNYKASREHGKDKKHGPLYLFVEYVVSMKAVATSPIMELEAKICLLLLFLSCCVFP